VATKVDLTPELERFAEECVADGRYHDVGDVVRSGLRLLQEQEEARREFVESLREAEEEADREGWLSTEEVIAEAREIVRSRRK
jgi:antitoxin ParD1/3/4